MVSLILELAIGLNETFGPELRDRHKNKLLKLKRIYYEENKKGDNANRALLDNLEYDIMLISKRILKTAKA